MPAAALHHTCLASHIRPCREQPHRSAGALLGGAAQLRGTPPCSWTARRQVRRQWTSPPTRRHGNHRVVSAAAGRDYYGLLGVPRDATAKDIKAAFRKKALKLHPDVNKAPDAKEQFMAAKEAFQVLSDADARARYDRQQRGGGGFDWGNPFGGGSSRTASSTGSAQGSGERRKKQEEEFYGFGAFFSDLEREWGERRKRRQKEPSSLWEELADLGEEFVEFLERELGLPPMQAEEAARNSDAASRNAAAAAAAGGAQRADAASKRARSDAQSAAKTAEQEAAAAKDEVEDMLAELKRKMGQ